jgi:hypothetical protein
MIGDARARGKVHGTTKNQKQPKHGRSYLTVTSDADTGSGGDREQKVAAKQMGKGKLKPGPGRDKQSPKAQRSRKIDAWCSGKSEDYT